MDLFKLASPSTRSHGDPMDIGKKERGHPVPHCSLTISHTYPSHPTPHHTHTHALPTVVSTGRREAPTFFSVAARRPYLLLPACYAIRSLRILRGTLTLRHCLCRLLQFPPAKGAQLLFLRWTHAGLRCTAFGRRSCQYLLKCGGRDAA